MSCEKVVKAGIKKEQGFIYYLDEKGQVFRGPIVVVGRRQGWKTRKPLTLLSLGAFVHTLSTISVGLLVGFLGHQIDQRFETFHGVIPGIILIGFGGGFFLSSFTHFHHEVSERVA